MLRRIIAMSFVLRPALLSHSLHSAVVVFKRWQIVARWKPRGGENFVSETHFVALINLSPIKVVQEILDALEIHCCWV